jgi:hypothetical protein
MRALRTSAPELAASARSQRASSRSGIERGSHQYPGTANLSLPVGIIFGYHSCRAVVVVEGAIPEPIVTGTATMLVVGIPSQHRWPRLLLLGAVHARDLCAAVLHRPDGRHVRPSSGNRSAWDHRPRPCCRGICCGPGATRLFHSPRTHSPHHHRLVLRRARSPRRLPCHLRSFRTHHLVRSRPRGLRCDRRDRHWRNGVDTAGGIPDRCFGGPRKTGAA